MTRKLDRLFHPRAIAVIGASQNTNVISGQPLKHLKDLGYRGKLYPVNPKYSEVLGERCYGSVGDLPEAPDVALIVVAAHRVPEALIACGEKGIPYAIVISSGFAEIGEAGKEAQRDIKRIAERYGIRIIGPNCQGFMNITDSMSAGFGATFSISYRKGPVSLISQSGAFGCAMLLLAEEEGLGFRHFVTTGNECDISTLELIEYFCEDEQTKVIAAYIEGLKDARRIKEVGQKALRARKPLLLWRVANTEAGARAAASHTANLGGSSALYRGAFRQAGVIELNDVSDLADYAAAFLPGRLPQGSRIAVVTTSGGAGIAMADQCTQAGMELPPLTSDSLVRLRKVVPTFAALDNPFDVTAKIIDEPQMLEQALSIIAADPNIDCIAVACAALSGTVGLNLARAVTKVYQQTTKPLLVAWNARPQLASEAYALVDRHGIPRYRTPVRCARAFSALSQYAKSLREFSANGSQRVHVIERRELREALKTCRKMLNEFDAKQVFSQYGIPVTREKPADSKAAALRIARELGYPVAMKVLSADIPHKTEVNGVKLDLQDETSASLAWDEIMTNVRRKVPAARIEGVLVQEQVQSGLEVILGAKSDPNFGPVVMFGLGGVFVEVMNDVSFRLAPITKAEALSMIHEIRASPILRGVRGRSPADVDALADALMKLSALIVDLEDIAAEIDVNPLFVLPAGGGVKAGDGLIRLKTEG